MWRLPGKEPFSKCSSSGSYRATLNKPYDEFFCPKNDTNVSILGKFRSMRIDGEDTDVRFPQFKS